MKNRSLTRRDIAVMTSERTGHPAELINEILGAALDTIADNVLNGADVRFNGFGCFSRVARAARVSNLPNRQGLTPARHIVKFKPYPALIVVS